MLVGKLNLTHTKIDLLQPELFLILTQTYLATSRHLIPMDLVVFNCLLFRLMWHFDLNKFRPSEIGRVKISLACVFAFMAIGWPLIVYKAGLVGWIKFWLMPWLGYHFWVYITFLRTNNAESCKFTLMIITLKSYTHVPLCILIKLWSVSLKMLINQVLLFVSRFLIFSSGGLKELISFLMDNY